MSLSRSRVIRVALGALLAAGSVAGVSAADWASACKDLSNARNQAHETRISPATAGALRLKWAVTTVGDVVASPAVDGNFVYFPDSAGFLYKVDKTTGAVIWQKAISDYTGIPGDTVRATPAVSGNALIFGNQAGKSTSYPFGSPDAARVVAVSKHTGALI